LLRTTMDQGSSLSQAASYEFIKPRTA